MNKRLVTLLKTIALIPPRQLAGQLQVVLKARLENPEKFATRRGPTYPGCRWTPVSFFLPPGMQHNSAGKVMKGVVSFLNVERDLGWPPAWDLPEMSLHWRLYLHYFDFIWALDYPSACAMVSDWMQRHPLKKGNIGWNAYPTALRLMNFCGYFWGRHREKIEADEAFRNRLWESIWLQAEWLSRHFEVNVGGNHFFEDGAGLAVAGACFDGPDAQRWFRKGFGVIAREVPRQILADGVHFSRAPMYQSRVVYIFSFLLNTGNGRFRTLLESPLRQVTAAMLRLCHPDGLVSLFNDSVIGTYNPPQELAGYAGRLPKGETEESRTTQAACESGFYVSSSASGHYLAFDAGAVRGRHMPGHSHGGLFSYELSLGGQRVVVDSGVFDYVPGKMRDYCKSTCAHNTVEIGGQDQSEYWDVFRVARIAATHDVRVDTWAGGFRVSGWHDGYSRMAGKPRHNRTATWYDDGVLMVSDEVTASGPVQATNRIHLHPDVIIEGIRGATAELSCRGVSFKVVLSGGGGIREESSFYCPEFGLKVPNRTLAFDLRTHEKTGYCIALGSGVELEMERGARIGEKVYAW